MASSSFVFLTATFLILCTLTKARNPGLVLTLLNNCPFTVWPAIQPDSGNPVLERGGFALNARAHRSFPAPTQHWSGRIWARTGCNYANNRFSCATGDCSNRLECNGQGGATPATLVQFSLHNGHTDLSSYAVSLVDGFNIPMTVTPHEGKGQCPMVGCRPDLLNTCPEKLKLRSPPGQGSVVACKSGCQAFGTDELCCKNYYNSPQTCRSSTYSQFFKRACPATFTYAHDNPSLMHKCSSPRELQVIFCH
ncbi:osmotin-like protein [Quercus suber]|uniref:osmotin-like protein n=1 Tax=Quercus suber TaxID=58331 RepID=UPI000CE2139D|nr:osmotin-like protein [Quercus suber]POF16669.1 osmotin-like protein [Quercus suber]